MAEAEATTTLFNSVFMSSTVCLTVASNVASSMTSIPLFACPRATRPARPNQSDRNAISVPPLAFQSLEHASGRHHVYKQKMHAGEDIVLVIDSQVLQLAEIVQRHRGLSAAGIVQLKV